MASRVALAELELIAEGWDAEVFTWEGGRVLRLLRTAPEGDPIGLERTATEAARTAGVRVPELAEEVEIEGRPGLVMERLEGSDLLTQMGSRPWTVVRTGKVTGRLHAGINSAPAPPVLPSGKDALGAAIDLLSDELGALGPPVRDVLAGLPDGGALCHGDFHPGQVMMSRGEPVVIDWTNTVRGDPLGDHARTLVLLRLGELPPGAPWPLVQLAKVARSLLLRSYESAYRETFRGEVDAGRLRRWEAVILAARLGERIPGEEDRILRALRATLAEVRGS